MSTVNGWCGYCDSTGRLAGVDYCPRCGRNPCTCEACLREFQRSLGEDVANRLRGYVSVPRAVARAARRSER